MPSTKDLRDRIRSVSNTAKVTGAMQMIAASKMTRAQNMVTNSRPYFETIHKMLTKVTNSSNNEEMLSEVKLLSAREVKKTLNNKIILQNAITTFRNFQLFTTFLSL